MQKDGANGRLTIKYFCFQASLSMRMLKMRGVRNVLLASGTLSPIQAFTYNMGLNFGAILENEHALKQVPVLTSVVTRGKFGGITGSYQNRSNPNYVADVAETLIRIMDATPQGVLIFFSSYSQMDDLVATWKSTKRAAHSEETFWQKMERSKKVVVEPRAKDQLTSVRLSYTNGVSEAHGAALFAVCRGKVSEGIDFCDAESRAVIIVGIPYPPIHDERVVLKRQFLDDLLGRKDVGTKRQSSQEWYQMEAFRAVNQAIGRVLRHKNDFGTVVLVDSRYASAKLEMFPKWLRSTIGKGDLESCAEKTARFFKERVGLIETSKSEYVKKQSVCKSFKQKRQTALPDSRSNLSQITIEEMFSPANMLLDREKTSKLPPPPKATSSFFSLPTSEDELKIKAWKQENEQKPSTSSAFSSSSNKRKFKVEHDIQEIPVVKKEAPKKKKLVLITRETLPDRFKKALEIPTSDIVKHISDENKKQFAATLKAYKSASIQWEEVFQRLRSIFVPHSTQFFVACSNILRSEDSMKFIKKAIDLKIY
ncbi:unnamed protein product [Caenorhabditis sp. 36 PRJEB53466]|nr:unnamed protein product [Caenorhabditis sp. 36 PRJEB53466]